MELGRRFFLKQTQNDSLPLSRGNQEQSVTDGQWAAGSSNFDGDVLVCHTIQSCSGWLHCAFLGMKEWAFSRPLQSRSMKCTCCMLLLVLQCFGFGIWVFLMG